MTKRKKGENDKDIKLTRAHQFREEEHKEAEQNFIERTVQTANERKKNNNIVCIRENNKNIM